MVSGRENKSDSFENLSLGTGEFGSQ